MKFSYKTMVLKGLKYVVLFGIPFAVDQFIFAFPEITQLSVGGLLVMVANYLKVRMGFKLIP